jgi:hypothetical protein
MGKVGKERSREVLLNSAHAQMNPRILLQKDITVAASIESKNSILKFLSSSTKSENRKAEQVLSGVGCWHWYQWGKGVEG